MNASRPHSDKSDLPESGRSSEGEATSATGIFKTAESSPGHSEGDLLASLLNQPVSSTPTSEIQAVAPTAASAQPPAPAQVAQPVASSPGEFTRMLETLKSTEPAAPAPQATPAASVAPPAAPGPGEFTRMMQSLKADDTAGSSATSQVSRNSGELAKTFTQVALERNVAPQPAAPLEIRSDFGSTKIPDSDAPAAPGSFTQVFSSSGVNAPSAPAPAPPVPVAPPAAKQKPGEFTRMFQSRQAAGQDEPAAPSQITPPANAEPGAFTRMFSQPNPAPAAQDPLRSLRSEPLPEPGSPFFSNAPRVPETPVPAQGGFTQLLRALTDEPAQKPVEPPMASPQASAPAPTPAAGGFTQLLQSLATPATQPAPAPAIPAVAHPASMPPVAPPAMAAAPVIPPTAPPVAMPAQPSGVGEFTRVISGSALRDLQSPGAAAPMAPPAAAPPAPQAAWTPPAAPRMPAPPGAVPQFAPPAFAMPPTPVPPLAAPAPQPSGLQKYLPLILILNVFLMLAIVLILFFALHHK